MSQSMSRIYTRLDNQAHSVTIDSSIYAVIFFDPTDDKFCELPADFLFSPSTTSKIPGSIKSVLELFVIET